ncbi:MAG TPA: ribosomal-processing cysteine protease Prp [Clostridia bacterium]|nr:ribosomal-processing cysteine protease Prp [Clostridia bacterium]
MINVTFFVKDGLIYGFELKGHSGYAPLGRDIVCAAVSSAAEMTSNTITQILGIKADVTESDNGYLKLTVPKEFVKSVESLLKGFRLHIKCISQEYPSNVKLRYGGTENA